MLPKHPRTRDLASDHFEPTAAIPTNQSHVSLANHANTVASVIKRACIEMLSAETQPGRFAHLAILLVFECDVLTETLMCFRYFV